MVFIKRIPDPEGDVSRQKLIAVLSDVAIGYWVGRVLIILGLFQVLPWTSPGVVLALILSYLLTVKLLHHGVTARFAPGEAPPLVWKRGWIFLEDPLLEALWRRRR
jgi:hypothetical protein